MWAELREVQQGLERRHVQKASQSPPESVKENGGRGTKKTARAQMWCLGEHDDNNAYDRNEKNVGMQGELR